MRRTVPSNRPAPRTRRPAPKSKGFPLGPFIAALAGLPGLFVVGMMSGEFAKSVVSTHQVDAAGSMPAAVSHSEEIRLDVSGGTRVAYIDPANVKIELARGWDTERTAFQDSSALMYFSGPFFEEHQGDNYFANAIGDLYFDDHLEMASTISRAFADRRYHMAITRTGQIEFGYSGWRPGFDEKYSTFIGGLGYLFSEDGPAADYSDPYTGFKQELHNMIPRERLLVGRDTEGHLIVMKTLPIPLSAAPWVAKSKGMVEAYYLDQGNKARFIVPGRIDDNPRYNLPYMLRISDRATPGLIYSPPPLEDLQLHHKKHRKRHAMLPTPEPSVEDVTPPQSQVPVEETPAPEQPPAPSQDDQPSAGDAGTSPDLPEN